jgi:hypothetical protein
VQTGHPRWLDRGAANVGAWTATAMISRQGPSARLVTPIAALYLKRLEE